MSELRLKFVFEKGTADKNWLDLYDGSVSLQGIARALTITTHAFLNGEVRTRGDAAHGAKFFLRPPQRGSFIFDTVIWISGAVASGIFYDYVKYTFHEATGIDDKFDNASPALQKRIEPTLGELPAVLESSLQDVHRPIRVEPKMTLKVMRPRGEILATFDSKTSSYLQPREINVTHPIVGNVTRYNTLSRWGRFFDKSEGRTVSFYLDPAVSERERSLITWSLHEANLNREGTLYLSATAIVTPTDYIKRYNVSQVKDRP